MFPKSSLGEFLRLWVLIIIYFIINKLSDYLKKTVNEVYKILKDVETLGNYIIECYDVLHAFDKFLKGLSD